MGGYNPNLESAPNMTRQDSAPAVMLKPANNRVLPPKPISEEATPHGALMNQIKRAASVSDDYVFDGQTKPVSSAPAAPPPPPAAPKFRQVKQQPIKVELSPHDELLAQIRKSGSISDDYVFDGANVEKQKNLNNNQVLKYENDKNNFNNNVNPDKHDILLSQIRGGFQLKPLPE